MKTIVSLLLVLLSSFFAPALLADTAETVPLIAYMQPSNEVPPTSVNATGNAIVWLHLVRDSSNAIISGSVDFDVTYRFPGADNITGLHIHEGPAGVSAGIVIPTDVSSANPVTIDAAGKGNVFRQVQFGGTGQPAVAVIQRLLANPENFYINLHTTTNPGGAIRAQLSRAQMAVRIALLSPSNETPPIADSNAIGAASFIVLRGTDPSGAFTIGAVIFDANYRGFPTDTIFNGFHIHKGPAGVSGPVTINTGIGSGANSVAVGTGGTGNLHYPVFVTPDDASFAAELDTLNGLFDNPSGFYANIHNTVNPGGEIRAQLRTTDKMEIQVNMLSSNEVPPVTGVAGNAVAKVTVYTARNLDGSVAAGAVLFDVDYRGFVAGTTVTGLHIHDGDATVSGPVTINTGLSNTNSVKSDTGSGNIYKLVTVDAGAPLNTLSTITQTPEKAYINFHTLANPGGVVRSQLAPANTALPVIMGVSNNPGATITSLAPGEIFSIYGSNLAKFTTGLDPSLNPFDSLTGLPVGLNGVSVTVGGIAAPLYYVSPTQINAQVPLDVATGPQAVVVKTSNGSNATSTASTVTIAASAPAIYAFGAAGNGAILNNRDFSLVTPDNPAKGGDVVIVYLTGLGQTTPALQTGNLIPGTGFNNTSTVTVTIGGQNAPVAYSIAAPGFAGLYQVAVTVPMGVSGNLPLIVTAGTGKSNSVNIAVK